MRALILAIALVASLDAEARSISLDPSKGQTLEAWSTHPDATVTEIHLLRGQHGRPAFHGVNGVSIIGEPGAIVGRTWVFGSRDIVFRRVTFRGLKDPEAGWKNALLYSDEDCVGLQVLDSNLASADDTSHWSDADWLNLPFGQLLWSNGKKAVIAGNNIFNAYNVLSINNNDWVISNNKMHDFVNDGIDFRGSNILIEGNRIFNNHDLPTNPMHADGMQGMAAYGNIPQPYTNVRIINNFVDAGLTSTSPMQGISAFDGRWKDVVLEGNYVRPRSYHGISWMGVDGITIKNNIVDQFRNARGMPIEHYPDLPKPWISVSSAKDHSPSSGLKIGRNVTPQYAGDSIAVMRPRPERVPAL